MQKQKGLVDTLAKNLHSENGSMSNDASVDRQMPWETPSQNQKSDYWASHGGRTAEWCLGESSSSASRFPGVSDEGKLEFGWRNSRRYQEQEQQTELSSVPLMDVSEVSSGSNQRNGFLFLQASSSAALSQDLNASAGIEDEEENAIASRRIVSSDLGHRSSDLPNLISGCSLDSQRLPHKRKSSEANVDHSPRGSDYSKRSERRQWQFPSVTESDISLPLPTGSDGLVLNIGTETTSSRIRIGGAVSSNSSFFNASERVESSNRSFNLNVNQFHQRDHGSGNQFSTERNVESSSERSSRIALQNYLYEMSQASRLGNGSSHHGQAVLHHSSSLGNHLSRWAASSSRRTSSNSSGSGGRNAPVQAESIPRNVSRTTSLPMFLPADGIHNLPEQPVNWSSANLHLGGNAGSTSRAGPSTALPVSSSSLPLRSSSRHQQRLSELRRFISYSSGTRTRAATVSSNPALQTNSPASPIPSLPDRPARRASNSSAARLERHLNNGVLGVPLPMRTFPPTSEGRRSIMSEIRHVLNLMRRGESLRFEDMMILDHSVLLGMADLHDRHRDMRMDVDNMSYEELLALEEHIGNVCTGLSEEAIAKHLKNRKHLVINVVDEAEQEPCCICRENYVAGEDVGELDCGHDFHTGCIKQWLMQKNLCPICKTTGLKT